MSHDAHIQLVIAVLDHATAGLSSAEKLARLQYCNSWWHTMFQEYQQRRLLSSCGSDITPRHYFVIMDVIERRIRVLQQ